MSEPAHPIPHAGQPSSGARLLVVPHVSARDIRVREIEFARCLTGHFQGVFCLEWADALHGISGGPIRRRWRQAARAMGSLLARGGEGRRQEGVRYLGIPVLQPILLRRMVGDEASLGLARRVNQRWLDGVVERFGITHVLLGTSAFGVPSRSGVKSFFDFVDWVPEETFSAAQRRRLRRELGWLREHVNGFFAVSEPLAEKLRREYDLGCAVLPNGAAIGALRAAPRAEIERVRAQWNLAGKYVLGAIGNHRDYVPLDFAVEVLRRVRRTMPDAALWIVGPAEVWRRRLEGEPGVIFTGQVPPEEIAAYFQAIDLGLLLKIKSTGTDFAFPIKVVEYTACRKFVLAAEVEAVRRLNWPNIRLRGFDPDVWAEEIGSLRRARWAEEWDQVVAPYDWSRLAEKAAGVMLAADRG